MLINLDAKGLEWVTCLYLSGDKVGRDEYSQGIDIHSHNKEGLGLPSRDVAKTFLFRVIYCDETGRGAYGFSLDPDFAHISSSSRWWQKRIDTFYSKYSGIAKWHSHLLTTVGRTGRLIMPWGREYEFQKKPDYNGDLQLPKTQIYNYPGQGLGAELMAIARVSLAKRIGIYQLNSLLVSTVHDSVLIDAPKKEVDKVVELVYTVFKDVPRNFEKLFGVKFDMELRAEVQVGETWGDMETIGA